MSSMDEGSTAKRSPRWTLVAVVGCIAIAYFFTLKVYRRADPANDDPSPLPRPKINAPFITTADPVINKMIEVGEITDKDLVYDLGCGDGRIVIAAAVQSGCHGVGFDIDPQRVAEAKENAERQGVKDLIQIEEQDVFKVDLTKADVIVAYLLPWMLRDLKPSFEQCRRGHSHCLSRFRDRRYRSKRRPPGPYRTERTTLRPTLYYSPQKTPTPAETEGENWVNRRTQRET